MGANAGEMPEGGWVIGAKRANGRAALQHYLVAANAKESALLILQNFLGPKFAVEAMGPAAAIHLTRRRMKVGDVQKI